MPMLARSGPIAHSPLMLFRKYLLDDLLASWHTLSCSSDQRTFTHGMIHQPINSRTPSRCNLQLGHHDLVAAKCTAAPVPRVQHKRLVRIAHVVVGHCCRECTMRCGKDTGQLLLCVQAMALRSCRCHNIHQGVVQLQGLLDHGPRQASEGIAVDSLHGDFVTHIADGDGCALVA